MNSIEVLSLYAAMKTHAEQKLAAAQDHDWDQVGVLTDRISDNVAALRAMDPEPSLAESELTQKQQYIHAIMETEAQSKRLIEARLAVLATVINASTTKDRIDALYGSESPE